MLPFGDVLIEERARPQTRDRNMSARGDAGAAKDAATFNARAFGFLAPR